MYPFPSAVNNILLRLSTYLHIRNFVIEGVACQPPSDCKPLPHYKLPYLHTFNVTNRCVDRRCLWIWRFEKLLIQDNWCQNCPKKEFQIDLHVGQQWSLIRGQCRLLILNSYLSVSDSKWFDSTWKTALFTKILHRY